MPWSLQQGSSKNLCSRSLQRNKTLSKWYKTLTPPLFSSSDSLCWSHLSINCKECQYWPTNLGYRRLSLVWGTFKSSKTALLELTSIGMWKLRSSNRNYVVCYPEIFSVRGKSWFLLPGLMRGQGTYLGGFPIALILLWSSLRRLTLWQPWCSSPEI